MVTGVMVKIDTRIDRSVAVILYPRSPRPPPVVVGRRVAPAVAVHDTQCHRRRQRDHKRYGKVVYYNGHLFVAHVVGQHHSPVLPRVVARETGALRSVGLGEVRAQHGRWVPATLYVHQQHRLLGPVRGLPRAVVTDVYVGAVVEVARAALSA